MTSEDKDRTHPAQHKSSTCHEDECHNPLDFLKLILFIIRQLSFEKPTKCWACQVSQKMVLPHPGHHGRRWILLFFSLVPGDSSLKSTSFAVCKRSYCNTRPWGFCPFQVPFRWQFPCKSTRAIMPLKSPITRNLLQWIFRAWYQSSGWWRITEIWRNLVWSANFTGSLGFSNLFLRHRKWLMDSDGVPGPMSASDTPANVVTTPRSLCKHFQSIRDD